jgi:hypothetical protein
MAAEVGDAGRVAAVLVTEGEEPEKVFEAREAVFGEGGGS